jgi:serine/threonine-protein kinase
MSPEQAQGQPIDHRSDLYAVGIVLYECLTGVNPFVGVTTADALMNQINVLPSRPSKVRKKARIPPYLDALVMRALNKNPDERFASAAEFRQVLEGLVLARQQNDPGEAPAVRTCEQCGRPLMINDQRCESCGEPLGAGAEDGYKNLLTPEFTHALEQREPDEIELELSPTSTVTASPSIGWDPPLVGLQREQETITGLLTRQRSFLRIIGPPGAGKGRLARETARKAAEREWQVIWVEPEIQPAYGSLFPIQQAASRLLHLSDSWLTEEDPLQGAAAIDFDMRHEQGFKDLFGFPMPQDLADTRRARRAEAWRAVVRGAAQRQPVLLVFFDLDCVDGPSQELVASLAADDQPTEHPLHVIVTQDRDLMLLWPETALINLQPLNREEATKLAQQLLESTEGTFSPESVVDASLGNPLMLIELSRLAAIDPQARFPKHVAEVINRRMSHLPPRARILLHAMAVAGRVSSPQTLISMIAEPEAGAGALSLLGEQGFMTISGSGWRPAHRVHGEVAYASTPAAVRTKLHRQAANLALDEGASPAQVAHHLFAAGEREEAVPYLLRAGWQALEALDEALATKQFNRVLQIVPAPPKLFGAQTEPWVLANLGLSAALADGGDLDAALQLLRGAMKTASDAGWAEDVTRFEQYQDRLRSRR